MYPFNHSAQQRTWLMLQPAAVTAPKCHTQLIHVSIQTIQSQHQQRTWLMLMNTAAPLVKPVMTQAY
jgi:hypothetical protein